MSQAPEQTFINILLWLMVVSVASGLCVLSFRNPQGIRAGWLASPSAFKRFSFHLALFLSCLLPPLSITSLLLTWLVEYSSLGKAMLSYPATFRALALPIPSAALCFVLYRFMLKAARASLASGVR
jgi:hypothetical protein